MRWMIAVCALSLAACEADGPRPMACTPATVPADMAEPDSTHRFRVATACVDRAADELATPQIGLHRSYATNAVAACAAEVRAALLAISPEERSALGGPALALDIPVSEDEWTDYAYERVQTFASPQCRSW